MFSVKEFETAAFRSNNANFEDLALALFNYQYEFNKIYRGYAEVLKIHPGSVKHLTDIPFLPIQFFKTHRVTTGDFTPELVFESSGTTTMMNSRHYIKDAGLYRKTFLSVFGQFYGNVEDYVILGLLPSYLERSHSSLVYMVNELIRQSGHPESGFYLYEHDKLFHRLGELEKRGQRTLLIGVTFALLDYAEKYQMELRHTIVMETGGMKGRREEWTREQVHSLLKERLGIAQVHSEYGMAELMSQAYAAGDGLFYGPPWMSVLLREEDDPLSTDFPDPGNAVDFPKAGTINIIDLANIHSCAFIATEDIGKLYSDGSFEVLGRMDNSALRGCSLMVS
ncbi:MAG TPA: acyl transferase [Chitinophagaceae bacterium]